MTKNHNCSLLKQIYTSIPGHVDFYALPACTAVTNAADKPMFIAEEGGNALGPVDKAANSSLVESHPNPVIATEIPDTKENMLWAINSAAISSRSVV